MSFYATIKTNNRVELPLVQNAPGQSVFNLPAGTTQVEVFRDAGIVYRGSAPDQYGITSSSGYITQVVLNTALSGTDILQIIAFT